MKILAIADIDDFHWNYGSGQADVLLSCGDVSDQVIEERAASVVAGSGHRQGQIGMLEHGR